MSTASPVDTTTAPIRADRGHDPHKPLIGKPLANVLLFGTFLCDVAVDHSSAEALNLSKWPTLGLAAGVSVGTISCSHIIGTSLRERRYGTLSRTGELVAGIAGFGLAGFITFVAGIRTLAEQLGGDNGSLVDSLTSATVTEASSGLPQWALVLAVQIGLAIAAIVVSYGSHTVFDGLNKLKKKRNRAHAKASAAQQDVAALLAARPRIIDAIESHCHAVLREGAARAARATRWFLKWLRQPLPAGTKLAEYDPAMPIEAEQMLEQVRTPNASMP